MDWLVASRGYWCCGDKMYDVVLSDSRTDPPTEVAFVAFTRGCALTGNTNLTGSVGYLDAYYVEDQKDAELDVPFDDCHEYLKLGFHAQAMRNIAREYMRAHTAPTRWRPRAHGEVHMDNVMPARLRKRARP
jgi:hypothetical protein